MHSVDATILLAYQLEYPYLHIKYSEKKKLETERSLLEWN